MLIFPLKKEWYEKIKSGEKTIEYREVKPYWTKRILKELESNVAFEEDMAFVNQFKYKGETDYLLIECLLRLGYTKTYMSAVIEKIEKINGINTDLHIDKPVYAIHLRDVREVKHGA